MLAKRVDEVPAGEAWIYEPKWDGFRTLIFRDGSLAEASVVEMTDWSKERAHNG
jgi:ATP-dependent DNA ligase